MGDYPKFQSIPRYFRDAVITEKVDGTNGLISIQPFPDIIGTGEWESPAVFDHVSWVRLADGSAVAVKAGSKNRWLAQSDDNFGFAKWVLNNAATLVADLGEGMHYGEWYGSGIQRGYGLTKGAKKFALFNVHRWSPAVFTTPNLVVVPTLHVSLGEHRSLSEDVNACLEMLEQKGSVMEPGFMNPEGVVIYHTHAKQYFKATLDHNDAHKGESK